MTTADLSPCEWCGEPTDETGRDNACNIAHCSTGLCMDRCRACLADMKDEADL